MTSSTNYHPVYWAIGTDIKLLFQTEKEYKKAKTKLSKTFPILCRTCLHEHNRDEQCGFAGANIGNSEIMGNCTACTYYDATEAESTRTEKLWKKVQELGTPSTLEMYRITNPKAYKVYCQLLKKYGVSSEKEFFENDKRRKE